MLNREEVQIAREQAKKELNELLPHWKELNQEVNRVYREVMRDKMTTEEYDTIYKKYQEIDDTRIALEEVIELYGYLLNPLEILEKNLQKTLDKQTKV